MSGEPCRTFELCLKQNFPRTEVKLYTMRYRSFIFSNVYLELYRKSSLINLIIPFVSSVYEIGPVLDITLCYNLCR